jgi:GTP cyclohydrolase I
MGVLMSTQRILGNGNWQLTDNDVIAIKKVIAQKFRGMFQLMGYDLEKDSNMRETPERIAKMYIEELFIGNYIPAPKFTVFPNTNKIDEMIVLEAIDLKSMCSHHFMPFVGKAHIAYIPRDKLCGISKLARVVKWFMRRPQIQEELTAQIADFIEKKLKPIGVAVIIKAQHMCMTMRGVNEFESMMTTSKLTGAFKEKVETRNEFLALIGKR